MMWEKVILGELIEKHGGLIQTGPFGSQLHESDYSAEGVPVVMPKDIIDGKILENSTAKVSEEIYQRLRRHSLNIGDIVLPRRGDFNRRAIITEQEKGWLCGTGCLKISLSPAVVSPDYLFYYISQKEFVEYMEGQAVGSTLLNLSASIVEKFEIKLPSLPIQHRISNVLSRYDALIENYQRQISLLEAMAQELYREWFMRGRCPYVQAQVDELPDGWEEKKLEDIATDIRRIVKVQDLDPSTLYVGLEHLSVKSIVIRDWGTADDVDSDKLAFEKSDILFGKIRPYQHKVCLSHFDGICSSDTIVIQSLLETAQGFLMFTIFDEKFIDFADKISNGTKMPRAEWNVLRNYRVVVPTVDILERFEKIIRPIFSKIGNLQTQITRLRQMRDKLLPRLMSEQLDVPEQAVP
jgi:type I restriction enzyme S subunit